MKCARELMNVAEVAKIAEAERTAQIIANAKKTAARYMEEEIAPSLEWHAERGEYPCTNRLLGFTEVDNVPMVAPLKKTAIQYAKSCRRTSYEVDKSRAFLLSHLEEYLERYCFRLHQEVGYYYSFNLGQQRGVRIYITPKPEC